MKNVAIFLIAVLGFGLVVGLLHNRLPDSVTWGLGAFVMLLIGYPIQRGHKSIGLSFARWAIFSALGGLIGAAVGFLIVRVF